MTGQLRPLVGLRWQMVRSPAARWAFAGLAALLPLLCGAAVVAGLLAPRERSFDVLLLAPSAYLSVAVLAVLAPLVAGGGNELFPAEQLVAYPVTARTHYLASLALTPLNLAWVTQLVGLVGLTAFVTPPGPGVVLTEICCLVYVAAVTVFGQAVGWWVVGVRARTGGRRLTWLAAAFLVAAGATVLVTGRTAAALDASPTTWVVTGAVAGSTGVYDRWALTVGALLVALVAAFLAGRVACAWSLRQPGQAGGLRDARPVRRRAQAKDALHAHLALDRAGVWRSQSLRRGLLVLGVLPGLVAAGARLDWPSLVLLPGLVAAGAGLLFGVNAFCLDGSGALWIASLPGDPGTVFRAKTRVVAEVCGVAVVLAVAAGASRAGHWPDAAELTAVVCCAAVAIAHVVATCMRLSTTRPHRAELRGPRETPAPPGVMAAYSLRLAVSTTLLAILFSGAAELGSWRASILIAVPFLLVSMRRLLATARLWRRPSVHAHVITVVSSG